MASVREQSIEVRSHIIVSDGGSLGPMVKYNEAARAVDTSWLSILDDDNYWLQDHVATILPHLDNADVVYTVDACGSRPFIQMVGLSTDELLPLFDLGRNSLDQSCAIRTEMYCRVGGFCIDYAPRSWPDQDLWYRIAEAGGRFVGVPKATWFYTVR